MIAIDTNVLLRYLLDDDTEQSPKAKRLLETKSPILLTDVVLVEMIWTLTGKRYGAGKEDIVTLIMHLLEEPHLLFEDRDAVWRALNDFMSAPSVKTSHGTKQADYSDCLIMRKAKAFAQSSQLQYRGTYTFDKAAALLDGGMNI